MADEQTRSPRPTRRARPAQQTRDDILAAARTRFGRDGYAATSLKDIAADAGVSVQTVYDSIGPKPELVRRLNDLIDQEAQVGELAARVATETEPAALARVPAAITRRLVERCGDLLRAALAAGQAEPELAPMVLEGQRRHQAGAEQVVARLHKLGALRPGLPPSAAARSLAVVCDVPVALLLVEQHGRSFDQAEDWMADAVARLILAGPG